MKNSTKKKNKEDMGGEKINKMKVISFLFFSLSLFIVSVWCAAVAAVIVVGRRPRKPSL